MTKLTWGWRAVAAFGTLLALAACDDDTEGSPGTPSSSIEGACARYTAAFCGYATSCATSANQIYGDAATCAARFEPACVAVMTVEDSAVAPEAIDACSTALESAGCGDSLLGAVNTCASSLVGTRAAGEPCGTAVQCQSGACSGMDGACGVCLDVPGAGEPCESECAPGLQCTTDGVCKAQTIVGENQACDAGNAIFCGTDLGCQGGVCVARLDEGATCASSIECKTTLRCDQDTMTCAPAPPPAKVGEACGFDDTTGAFVSCDADGYCNDGSCAARVADGASCTDGAECMIAAECVDGVCSITPPTCN